MVRANLMSAGKCKGVPPVTETWSARIDKWAPGVFNKDGKGQWDVPAGPLANTNAVKTTLNAAWTDLVKDIAPQIDAFWKGKNIARVPAFVGGKVDTGKDDADDNCCTCIWVTAIVVPVVAIAAAILIFFFCCKGASVGSSSGI
jgi:hypothetical protein